MESLIYILSELYIFLKNLFVLQDPLSSAKELSGSCDSLADDAEVRDVESTLIFVPKQQKPKCKRTFKRHSE